ncbi:MAG: AAA family ATPase [Clostridium celatum]|nr:AAA family ATPase [Clostridium celatum]
MNIDEFKKLQNQDEKKKKIMEYFNINKPTLVGSVKNKIPNKLWIHEIHSIDGGDILNNPFDEFKKLEISVNLKGENIDFNIKDKVYFKFDVNRNEDILGAYPIVIKSNNMVKLIEIENSNLPLKQVIVESLRKKNKSENISKLLVEENIKDTLSEIVNNCENKLTLLEEKKKYKKEELNNIELKINKSNRELKEKDQLKAIFKKYGFNFSDNNKENNIKGKTNIAKDKYIEYIKNYLAFREGKKLYYSKEVLEQFYAGLCTNQLLVLSGQPGTGKTSLVEGFCNAIAAKLKIISVQPNWTDNQDLLGFFNPIECTYISTPFLDAILEAESNPEQLHIICLDEMNLAHVEYYFSEFLSKLQSEDKKVTLYSEYLYKEAREEILEKIEFFIGKMESDNFKIDEKINSLKAIDFEEHYKLKKKWNSINRYKHEIKIPDNVRFVGTINKDETTKNLSPKVIDRSYIMEIDNYTEELVKEQLKITSAQRKKYSENLYIKPQEFIINNISLSSKLKNKLSPIANILKKANITLSNRLYNQIEELNGAGIFNECDIFDAIVATKILPKLNIEIDNEDKDIRKELRENIKNTSISRVIFEKMEKNSEESGMEILTFWR